MLSYWPRSRPTCWRAAPDRPGRADRRGQRTVGLVEQCFAGVQGDGAVPGDEGGGIEQRHRFGEGAPPPGVDQVGKGVAVAGEGQRLGDGGIPARRPDQVQHGPHDGAGDGVAIGDPRACLHHLYRHRSLTNPSAAPQPGALPAHIFDQPPGFLYRATASQAAACRGRPTSLGGGSRP